MQWSKHTEEQISSIQGTVLQFVMQHAQSPQARVVVSTLVGMTALLLKRRWGEMSQEHRAGFFKVNRDSIP